MNAPLQSFQVFRPAQVCAICARREDRRALLMSQCV